MASETEIANLALTKLGARRIIDLSENTKEAREVNGVYPLLRDSEMARFNWRFTIRRALLAQHVDAPAWGYPNQFRLPADCLRAVQVGEWYPPVDLSDYRGADASAYAIENGFVMTRYAAPLPIRYVARITDAGAFSAVFVEALACKLAMALAEPLTAANGKRELAEREYSAAIKEAVLTNSIELPPAAIADDTWIMARISG